ncbi:uncharacterized protein LOC100874668 [Megachile rotundata]|uniref:uncharacterized protein LOC100874668 n=1 Tax=Megachile rotundata TaxID=143995 RepID=UPI003FD0D005
MVVLKDTTEDIEMTEISISEQKRLESIRNKKKAFRSKELIVQNALKNLDKKPSNNKIIFDEDIDQIEQTESKKKAKKRKRDLFDNDDNDEGDEPNWDNDKLRVKEKRPKFAGSNGMDERFKLDERFIEDDVQDENNTTQMDDESDLKKEKELELDILENILGVPCNTKNKTATTEAKSAKKGMIRYDPTKDNHKEYEITTEKPETTKKKVEKKKKTKERTESVTENPPVEVSKDIYFSVSESLTKSLKEGGQFSLLNKFGSTQNNEKGDDDYNAPTLETSKPPKFQFEPLSKNPFKYDSSDDEHEDQEAYENNEQNIKDDVVQDTHKFFFDVNDTRFNEAVTFFSKEFSENDTFKDLRHELKQIVRSKIRNNIKKVQPFGRKNKIKRLSKKVH